MTNLNLEDRDPNIQDLESNNTNLKRLIRKAKSPLEVTAYTTILLLDDFMNDKTVTDLWDETPNLIQKLKEVAEVVFDERDKS